MTKLIFGFILYIFETVVYTINRSNKLNKRPYTKAYISYTVFFLLYCGNVVAYKSVELLVFLYTIIH